MNCKASARYSAGVGKGAFTAAKTSVVVATGAVGSDGLAVTELLGGVVMEGSATVLVLKAVLLLMGARRDFWIVRRTIGADFPGGVRFVTRFVVAEAASTGVSGSATTNSTVMHATAIAITR